MFFGDLLGNATEGSGTIYIESGSDGGGGGGKVLLAGAPTETNSTSHRVTVINTAANGLQVSSGNYTIGRLYGSGTVFIDEDAILCIANQVDSGAITVADGGGVISSARPTSWRHVLSPKMVRNHRRLPCRNRRVFY